MNDLLSQPPLKTGIEFKQRLRLRRFMQAGTFSIFYLLVMILFYTQGKVDRVTLLETGAIVMTAICIFFAIFRLGINLRFPDPSLTVFQFFSAVFTMLFVVYRAPESRMAFTAFFFVALMFGMLRCSVGKLTVLGSVTLAGFAFAVGSRFMVDRDVVTLRLDLLQFLVIAITFPWFVFVGLSVKKIQRDLASVSIKLEDIEEIARRDDLTGVYNRRALMIAMEGAVQRVRATGEPLSICVIDLDLFKRYNDEFDHLTGDRVLQAFAQAVRSGLRSTDVFGRYGGEEFVQILPSTPLAGALHDAERLRNRIQMLDIPFARSMGPLTVSIGVAQYRPGETVVQTFARADEALYRAKQSGRNRVEC